MIRSPFRPFVATAAAAVLLSAPSLLAQEVAWAWVTPSTAGATFTPNPNYQYTSSGGTITVSRSPTQQNLYYVDMPGFSAGTGVVQAHAYGGDSVAVVNGWGITAGTVRASVEMFDLNGVAANDAAFTISYRLEGDDERREAYLWANNPTAASYTPSAIYAWNGNRAAPTIQRLNTGHYRVRLPGLAPLGAEGGHVQVTPYGSSAMRAKVATWNPGGGDQLVDVRTYDATGSLADQRFTLSYQETAAAIDGNAGSGAHVWANDPFAASYVPTPTYTDSNGPGGPDGVERITRVGVGSYDVYLPDMIPTNKSYAAATSYGNDNSHAVVQYWSGDGCGGTIVRVRTFDANGGPADARFDLIYLSDEPARQREVAWAWVYPVNQGASFTPSATYQHTTSGQTITVDRFAGLQHRYVVKIPGMSTANGTAHASAYGGNHTAVVNSWSLVGSAVWIYVDCWTPSGGPANDAAFTVHFRSGGNDRTREAYCFANSPNANSYTPATDFSFNADRPDPTITRGGTGSYTVFFPGLDPLGAELGHVQVTPYGPGLLRAKVSGWAAGSTGVTIGVRVYDGAGNPSNGRFMVSYNEVAAPIGDMQGSGAHVWAGQPFTASYLPGAAYTDENGTVPSTDPIEVSRLGVGVYQVELPTLAAFDSSTVQVTAYGGGSEYASVSGWAGNGSGGTQVTVRCYDAAGAPADEAFTMLYLSDDRANGDQVAQNDSYGNGCYGMTISGNTRPMLCQPWQINLDSVPAGALIGILQLDMVAANTPLGLLAPGCTVLTGGAVTEAFLLPSPNPVYSLFVPANPALVGQMVYAQGGAWVPGINQINIALSQGLRGTIGDL
ncbi:MAG: hypothetical protein ACE37K_15070 [Planctomycetota bacterium]